MSWALDRAWATVAQTGSGTTHTFTYAGAVASGALLVAFTFYDGSGVTVSGVSDTVNGSWTQATGTGLPCALGGGSAGRFIDAWYFLNSAAGTPVITFTYSGTVTLRCSAAGSYTGIATAGAYDVGHGNGNVDPGTGTDAVTSGATGTTAQANDLAIGFFRAGSGTTITAESGWTQRVNELPSGTGNGKLMVEDKNITSATTVTAHCTIDSASDDPGAVVVTFKEPATGRTTKNTRSNPLGQRVGVTWRIIH